MADAKNIFKQIGNALKQKSKQVTQAAKAGTVGKVPTAKPGTRGATVTRPTGQVQAGKSAVATTTNTMPGEKKPFDFSLYMVAVQNGSKEFFQKQVPWFFKNIGPAFKGLPAWWKGLKQDEQLAYAGWITGHVFTLIGIVLLIVL